MYKINGVYLLNDNAWLDAEDATGNRRLLVAEHRQAPVVVTQAMVSRGDVPSEVVDWYKDGN